MIFTPLLAASISIIASASDSPPEASFLGDQAVYRSDFRASTYKPSAQAEAAFDVDALGNITVVWSSRKQQYGRSAVFMQRFTPQGVAIGGETQLNLWTKSNQVSPCIASACGAVTWIAWQSHGQDGDGASIIARRFVTDASQSDPFAGGSEFAVDQEWLGDQTSPAVAASSDGAAAFAWTSMLAPGVPPTIRARLFDAGGDPITDEFAVANIDDHASRIESLPGVAVADDGTIAVVFAIADTRGYPAGIRMQRFDRCGARLGGEITVAPDTQRMQVEPVIAAAQFGFVIAWDEARPGDEDYDVLAQRFDRAGNPLDAPFIVNDPTSGLQNAAAIAARDDRFVIAWNSDDDDKTGIFAQTFATDGRRIGTPLRINSATHGDQALRPATSTHRLGFAHDGSLLCAWNGDAGLGDRTAAHMSMLSQAPVDLGDLKQGVTPEMVPAALPDETLLASANASGGPEPHQPPTFDPRTIDKGRRDYVYGVTDFGFTGILSTGWTPPDPHMAVGPNNLVLMTNGAIAFFSKAGDFQFQSPIEGASGFWGSVGATNFVFDPETLYDPISGRFFAMASEQTSASQSFILIAVSDDSDPNGTWYKYRFNTTALAGATYDSPNMAVDANVVYISGDGSNGSYAMFMYDKPSLLAGVPPVTTRTASMPTSTQSAGMPPVSFDNPPALYFIEHKESPSNTQVRLIALTDPLGTPTFTSLNMNVATYGPPENPPQMGTTVRPVTFDARFWSCAYRNGSLWATHHINSSRVLVRWYEFAMNGWPTSGNLPALVQSGNIDPGGTVRTFFTAITADAQNNAALVFARSSPSEFISMQTAYRSHNDPPNTFQPMVQRQINIGPYSAASRWGDYAGMNVDPVDGHTMWAHHEYAQNNTWRTWVQSFYPGLPCPADIAPAGPPKGDGVVNSADLLEVINNWGLCAGCPADINNDAAVNVSDLLTVINAWGPCP